MDSHAPGPDITMPLLVRALNPPETIPSHGIHSAANLAAISETFETFQQWENITSYDRGNADDFINCTRRTEIQKSIK